MNINKFAFHVQWIANAINLVVLVVLNNRISILLKIIVFANFLECNLRVIVFVEILIMINVNVNIYIIQPLILWAIVVSVIFVQVIANVVNLVADNVIQVVIETLQIFVDVIFHIYK